jgi:hypothetical protein
MKRLLSTIPFILVSALVFGQDLIVLKNGDDIPGKVLEVTQDEVKYKKQSNPDGPTYTIDKDFVFFVKYANGEKDMFSEAPEPVQSTPSNAPSSSNQTVNSDKEKDNVTEKKNIRHGHFITAFGGASFPIGAFASTSASKTNAGFASIGYLAGLQGAYFPIPYVGLGANVGFIGNPLDDQKYKAGLLQTWGLNAGNFSTPLKAISSSHWNNIYFTFQPHFQYPTKVVNIALTGHVGGMQIITPGVDVTYGYQGEFYEVRVVPSSTTAFAYGGGLDFRFRVTDRISIAVGGSFLTAEATADYQYNYTRTSPSYAYQEVKDSGKVSVMVITANAGITINLDKKQK